MADNKETKNGGKVTKKSNKKAMPVTESKNQKKTVAKESASSKKTETTSKNVTTKKKSRGIGNIKYLGGLLLKKMAFGGAKELSSNADEVNKLNVFPVPDGDTGDNMRMTIESGICEMESVDSDNIGKVLMLLNMIRMIQH